MQKLNDLELEKNLKNDWVLILSKLLLHNGRTQKQKKPI